MFIEEGDEDEEEGEEEEGPWEDEGIPLEMKRRNLTPSVFSEIQ